MLGLKEDIFEFSSTHVP